MITSFSSIITIYKLKLTSVFNILSFLIIFNNDNIYLESSIYVNFTIKRSTNTNTFLSHLSYSFDLLIRSTSRHLSSSPSLSAPMVILFITFIID